MNSIRREVDFLHKPFRLVGLGAKLAAALEP